MPKSDLNVNSGTVRINGLCMSWEEISKTPKRLCFICRELTRGRARWHRYNSTSLTRPAAFCLPCAIKETLKVAK
jgi:hypothetical protein